MASNADGPIIIPDQYVNLERVAQGAFGVVL